MTVLWYILGSLAVGLAASLMVGRRPVAPRPDYRLIWDLEEELGFAHLTMDRRPAPVWSDAPGQVIEVERDWYRQYRASIAEGYEAAQTDWKNLALTPTGARCDHCGADHTPMFDCVAAGVLSVAEWDARRGRQRREADLLSSVDRSLRVSGERGFL